MTFFLPDLDFVITALVLDSDCLWLMSLFLLQTYACVPNPFCLTTNFVIGALVTILDYAHWILFLDCGLCTVASSVGGFPPSEIKPPFCILLVVALGSFRKSSH